MLDVTWKGHEFIQCGFLVDTKKKPEIVGVFLIGSGNFCVCHADYVTCFDGGEILKAEERPVWPETDQLQQSFNLNSQQMWAMKAVKSVLLQGHVYFVFAQQLALLAR